jgi:type IV secretion system protein TrbG
MTHGRWSALSLLWVLVGCATPQVQLSPFDVSGPPARPQPIAEPPRREPMLLTDAGPKEAQAAVSWAASQALVRPKREYFRHGMLVYPKVDGRKYAIKTRTRQPTDIFFPEGEQLTPWVGLDDWWEVKEVYALDPGSRARLVVMPKEPGLKASVTVTTTGGAYYLELESDDRPGIVSVTWEKPSVPPVPSEPVVEESLGGGYMMEIPTPAPLWVPVRVYHNRYQTFIQCHPTMTVSEAPVVYALDREGKRQLVNRTLRDDTLVIDRRGIAFELQGSGGPSDIVRVRYVGETPTATAGGHP